MTTPHILVIDDDTMNLAVMLELLDELGINHTDVADASKLPSLLTTLSAVDAVLLDLEMPNMNGYEAYKLIRQHLGNIPIVACTVHMNEITKVKEAGFQGFIPKPIKFEKFPEQINRILNHEPIWERN